MSILKQWLNRQVLFSIMLLFASAIAASMTGCDVDVEDDNDIEDAVEEVGDAVEDAVD